MGIKRTDGLLPSVTEDAKIGLSLGASFRMCFALGVGSTGGVFYL